MKTNITTTDDVVLSETIKLKTNKLNLKRVTQSTTGVVRTKNYVLEFVHMCAIQNKRSANRIIFLSNSYLAFVYEKLLNSWN